MPTIITHAIAGAAIGAAFAPRGRRGLVTVLAVLVAALPDADALGFRLGLDYGSFLGHRGFTHSLIFALLMGGGAFFVKRNRFHIAAILVAAAVLHGILDAMTDGGLGVAFLAPWDNTRYFFPFHPIRVAPLSVRRFFMGRGWVVLGSELLWVWLPAGILMMIALMTRRRDGVKND